jgi:hypothetical protein
MGHPLELTSSLALSLRVIPLVRFQCSPYEAQTRLHGLFHALWFCRLGPHEGSVTGRSLAFSRLADRDTAACRARLLKAERADSATWTAH